MKIVVFGTLSVALVLQLTAAFPRNDISNKRFRLRRDVENANTDLQLSSEALEKRNNLEKYLIKEMVRVTNETVSNHKELFEKVVDAAKEADLKSDALNEHLKKFTDLIKRANERTDSIDEESLSKLFSLFSEFSELGDSYDDVENPTEEEKLLKRLLDENGGPRFVIQFLIDFLALRENYENNIQEYVDSLSEEDKKKDAKLVEWYHKFKNAKSVDSFVDTTMEIFDILSGEDDEENEE